MKQVLLTASGHDSGPTDRKATRPYGQRSACQIQADWLDEVVDCGWAESEKCHIGSIQHAKPDGRHVQRHFIWVVAILHHTADGRGQFSDIDWIH